MSRTIDAQQSPLRYRADLFRLDLIKLTTYTDRTAKTVDKVFYFSRDPVTFDYGNTGTDQEFWPVIAAIGELAASVNHLPSQGDTDLIRKPLEITLNNIPWEGSRISEVLRDGHELANATVEWTQVLLADKPTTARIDLTALAGDEHTFWYRGRVTQVGPITNDSITLQCETDMPTVDWLVGTDVTKVDPEHIGRRVAKVYGSAKRVECINWDVGFVTTLAENLDADATDIELTDITGFATSNGEVFIGAERVLYSTAASNRLQNATRGVNNSLKSFHAAGSIVVEVIDGVTFVVADHECLAVPNVYVRSPFHGKLVRITTPFTVNLADTTTISGRTITSITMTKDELTDLLFELSRDPEITDDGSSPGDPTVQQTGLAEDFFNENNSDRMHLVVDGDVSETADHSETLASGQSIYVRFAKPEFDRNHGRQRIQVWGDPVSSMSLGVYAADLRVFPGQPLLTTLSFSGSTYQQQDFVHSDENDWYTIKNTSGVSIEIFEVRQYTDAIETRSHQQADRGQIQTRGEVSSGNWFDENDSTFESLGISEDWVSVRFPVPSSDFVSQVIKIRYNVPNDGDIKLQHGDALDGSWTDVFVHAPGFQFQPRIQPTVYTYNFETKVQDRFWRVRVSENGWQIYEISRDIVTLQPSSQAISIAGVSVGMGLRLFADVDGYAIPAQDPAYGDAVGAVIEKPADVVRHFIEQPGTGVPAAGAATVLGSGSAAPDSQEFVTGSMDFRANETILFSIVQATDGNFAPFNPSTVVTPGLTWSFISGVKLIEGGFQVGKVFTYRASTPVPVSGVITVTWATQAQNDIVWSVSQFPDTDVSVNDGMEAAKNFDDILLTSVSVTMDAFDRSTNLTVGICGTSSNATWVVGSGFTQLSAVSVVRISLQTQWKDGEDVTVDMSMTSGAATMAITGFELKRSIVRFGAFGDVEPVSYAAALTNLGSDVWGFDVRTLGLTFPEILARMGFEGRMTIIQEAAASNVSWKMLTALSTYAFSSASGSVSVWNRDGFAEAGQSLVLGLASRFQFFFAPDWTRGTGEEAFTQILIGNTDDNDFTTPSDADFDNVTAIVGSVDAQPMAFRCIQDLATAKDVAGYYAHELIRQVAIFAVGGVPWWEGYDLEVGDIINVTPPWATSAVKSRIIEYTKNNETEQIELRLVEVQ